MKNTRPSTKTILVLGASYGGSRTAQVLAAGLKDINARAPTKEQQWRVVLVDRNHHANHLYIFSRISVLPGHEHKAFIPYTNVFALHPPHPEGGTTFPPSLPHSFIHAKVNNIDLHANEVRLQHLSDDGERKKDEEETIAYDYLVYAMGSHLPAPIDMWGERIYKDSAAPSKELPSRNVDLEEPVVLHPEPEHEHVNGAPPKHKRYHLPLEVEALAEEEYRGLKPQAVARMRADQKRIAAAQSVLVVGGGALGIQYATDISAVHPATKVTLLHSRTRLLPKFDKMMHTEILQTLKDAGVKTILGERLSMKSLNHPRYNEKGEKVLITENGREICADLVLLCTGQRPNTRLLAESDSTTVDPNTGMTRVARTMQVTGSRPRARRGSGPTLSSSPEVEEETAAVALNRLSSITLDRRPNGNHIWSIRTALKRTLTASSMSSTLSTSSSMTSDGGAETVPSTPTRLPPGSRFRLPTKYQLSQALRKSSLLGDAEPLKRRDDDDDAPSETAEEGPNDLGDDPSAETGATGTSHYGETIPSPSSTTSSTLYSSQTTLDGTASDAETAQESEELGDGSDATKHSSKLVQNVDDVVPASGTEKSQGTATSGSQPISILSDARAADTSILAESGPQIDAEADEAMVYEHVFAIGDAADAFGAIQAGHNAYYQGEVAARNILKLVKKRVRQERLDEPLMCTSDADVADGEEDLELEHYTPGPPAIKVSLGITKSVYQINGVVGVKDDGTEDLDAAGVWAYFGIKGVKEERMYD